MRSTANAFAIVALFAVGFWAMAAGGILGGAVHQMPSMQSSLLGCAISTAGLGLCLYAIRRTKPQSGVGKSLSYIPIIYGFYHSLLNISFQAQFAPTLIYGIYMGIISAGALMLVPRAFINSSADSSDISGL